MENPGFPLDEVHQHLADAEAYEGQSIGGYALRELIGVGGSGAVFQAVHRALGRHVALKLFFPFDDDVRMVARTTEHAVRGISCLRHPGIAALLDYGYERIGIGAAPYLAEPFERESFRFGRGFRHGQGDREEVNVQPRSRNCSR